MKTIIHRATDRGHATHGWLNSYHSFSFAGYNNPDKVHFGALRVLNDDTVSPGMGFGSHPHDNMEIVSIPLKGALKHKDNTGRQEIIQSGDVQIMSAGSGIVHSEVNASGKEPVEFLQIWVFPKLKNIDARYEQKTFSHDDRKNKLQIVVSPDEKDGGVWINQDAKFLLGDFETGNETALAPSFTGNGIYLFVLEGEVEVAGEKLSRRDGIGLSEFDTATLKATADAQVLVIDVPMNF
jgi:redox-sensitive bicupin YhaK (pirin superfamily)